MERVGAITVDITIMTLLVLMMATTAQLFLFWNEHINEHHETMSDFTLSHLNRYLFRRLVYFCVLWWLLTKTVSVHIPESNPGGELTGLLGPGFLENSSGPMKLP